MYRSQLIRIGGRFGSEAGAVARRLLLRPYYRGAPEERMRTTSDRASRPQDRVHRDSPTRADVERPGDPASATLTGDTQ